MSNHYVALEFIGAALSLFSGPSACGRLRIFKLRKIVLALAGGTALVGPASASGAPDTITYSYDARGRLIQTSHSGGANAGIASCYTYDSADNRQNVVTNSGCSAPVSGPANSPPVTRADAVSVVCKSSAIVNVTANDTDPEGNLPLTVTDVVVDSGDAMATVYSPSSIQVFAADGHETATATYTVKDSLNASSTGTLTINSVGSITRCDY